MKPVLEVNGGRWLEIENKADGHAASKQSFTFVSGYVATAVNEGAIANGVTRFFGFQVDQGREQTMPVILMTSTDITPPSRPTLVCGYMNTNPYPNYADEIRALSDLIGIPLPPEAFPYRLDRQRNPVDYDSATRHSDKTTPRWDDLARQVDVENEDGSRWIRVPGWQSLAFVERITDANLFGLADSELDKISTLNLLVPPVGQPFRVLAAARIVPGSEPGGINGTVVTAPDYENPYEEHAQAIERLASHCGTSLPEECYPGVALAEIRP